MSLRLIHIFALFGMLAIATPSLYSQSSEAVDSVEICEMVKLAKKKIAIAIDKYRAELDSLDEKIDELHLTLDDREVQLSDEEREKIKQKLDKAKRKTDEITKEWFEPDGKFDKLAAKVQENVLVKMNAVLERLGKLKGLEQIYLWNNCD